MPFWGDLLCESAHEEEDYALKWPGLCAGRQGITALIGEIGEFAAERLISLSLDQNEDIRDLQDGASSGRRPELPGHKPQRAETGSPGTF